METNVLIHKDKNLIEGLKKLSELQDISRLILFVIDDNNRVIGSVTDGDIRRSIVNEQNLQKKLGDICNRSFKHLLQSSAYQSFESFRNSETRN